MEPFTKLFEIDYFALFVSVLTILAAFKIVYSLAEWFINKFGWETKGMRKRHEKDDLIITTKNDLNALSNDVNILSKRHDEDIAQLICHDDMIRQEFKKLTDIFIDKEIEDMRWEIINFSTKVSEGKPCNRDGYQHCFRTYEKYEKLISENGLENGEVSISMEVVNESYKDKLKSGFFKEPTHHKT